MPVDFWIMRASKKLSKTLLIVCEGSSTEPDYFLRLADIAIEKEIYSNIVIYPRPREIEEAEEREKARNERRRVRQFSRGEKGVQERIVERADQDELPFVKIKDNRESWATPLRYIKEARDRVKLEEFDEAWAVFDQDGHADPEKAYNLADIPIEGKKISIAFSAVSFEHWILLHFERNGYAFKKSQCKDHETDDSKVCGTGVNQEDCFGQVCIAGHMVVKGHVESYDKSNSTMLIKTLLPRTEYAILNAAWLRAEQHEELAGGPSWLVNPYTDVDDLVKIMLGISARYVGIPPGSVLELEELIFTVKQDQDIFELLIINRSKNRVATKQFTLQLDGVEQDRPKVGLLEIGETLSWDLPTKADDRILILTFADFVIPL